MKVKMSVMIKISASAKVATGRDNRADGQSQFRPSRGALPFVCGHCFGYCGKQRQACVKINILRILKRSKAARICHERETGSQSQP